MPVNIVDAPAHPHTRYVLITEEAPALTTVHGMLQNLEEEEVAGVLVVAADSSCEPVAVEQEPDGTWVIYQSSPEGRTIEEIRYSVDGDQVVHHQVFVEGFATEQTPVFAAL